ncbi:MAG: metal ABC transporter ATP-binding protein [Fibrobacterota bacterium]
MALIEVEELSAGYGQDVVLENISFSLKRGDFLAVTGPNGGGKSTLIKAIMGIIPPMTGTVYIDPAIADRIGYMPQSSSAGMKGFPATVYEIAASALWAKKGLFQKLSSAERSQIEHALGLLQIENLRDRRIDELSGGQKQRVFLARAFALEPEILVLDEPTGALDRGTRECFYETLRELNEYHGKTILMITHDSINFDSYVSVILDIDRDVRFFGPASEFGKIRKHYFRHHESRQCEGCAQLAEKAGCDRSQRKCPE